MPRARDRAAARPEEVDEPMEEITQDAGHALRFDQPLTWRAGKPIAVGDLLRRLKTLFEELATIEQGDADRETLVPKAQELANAQLLGHKDKGVKAWTMQCVVEMFRLLAPDAPYKSSHLKQIFEIFISTIVPALGSPSDPYSQQHLGVLTSLTNVKSIILLTDIPGSDQMILTLFANCFDVVSGTARGSDGEKLPKNVEYHLTELLCILVDECTNLPPGVTDITLAQFLRADPSLVATRKGEPQPSTVLAEVTPAYNMAKSICNTNASKMSRDIGQYFSSVLIDASESFSESKTSKHTKPRGRKRTHDESEDESDHGLLTPPTEDDFAEVEKAHRLLRELWRSSPDVVQSMIPQLEAEVSAETGRLRTMAVQTIGDMIAGIGAAGPPPAPLLDPAAYPSQSLDVTFGPTTYTNVLLEPAAPYAFSSVYPNAYQSFVDRHRDKSVQVRTAWTTAAGRIVVTSGGGKGLDTDQEAQLLRHLSDMLVDQEEKVRLAAVNAVAQLDFRSIVQKLGANGGVDAPGSVLCNLADRIKDRKQMVRGTAMELLGRIWGVAAGAIAEGSERVREILGAIPTKILVAMYINEKEVNAVVQRVLYDSLLPVGYPPIKPKPGVNGDAQRVSDSQIVTDTHPDPDAIRAERVLVLVRDLDTRAKTVFFSLQQMQGRRAKYLETYIEQCEALYLAQHPSKHEDDAEESVDAKKVKDIKKKLDTLVVALSRDLPEPEVSAGHLKKFAAFHNRRCYQLIRFCYSPASDYRKITKAMKEFRKHMEEAPSTSGMGAALETLTSVVLSASLLVYNRSHVPGIMDLARKDEKGLGNAAREVLSEISNKAPEVFKVHVQELCESLKKQAPTATSQNEPTAVDTLKACAGFAQRFPDDMPKDRDFFKAMAAFAKHGTPPEAAKHAVTVIVASAEKKDMHVKEIIRYCVKDFESSGESFLSRLAALSQLRLLASKETEEHAEAIIAIAINDVLSQVGTEADESDPEWTNEIDDDLCAKLWALKILANGLRGMDTKAEEANEGLQEAQAPVYQLLNTLVDQDGQLAKTAPTAKHHKAHLRLAAAKLLLKLSCSRTKPSSSRTLDHFLTPHDFNRLARVAQDVLPEVRAGFAKTLEKYLGQGRLPNRFYGLLFIYAFEPTKAIKEARITWLRSRAAMAAKSKDPVMESVFARFLSLLAHHQDFSTEPEELEDFVEYIMFYLKTVATQDNLPLIYHIAQRVKTVADGIDPDKTENLHTLSDLAEAVIRLYQEARGWSLQLQAGKVRLPAGIFAALPSHAVAQEISERRYLPEELADRLEGLVKESMKTKKRKSDGSTDQATKKAKSAAKAEAKKAPARKASKAAKTPKKKKHVEDAAPSSERRKSTRASNAKSYAEGEDSEDDDELERWQEENEHDDDEANKENISESSPPTSDPVPAPAAVKKEKAAKKPTRAAPQRSTRATKGRAAKGGEKDVMDIPSDTEEELSDVPDDMEV